MATFVYKGEIAHKAAWPSGLHPMMITFSLVATSILEAWQVTFVMYLLHFEYSEEEDKLNLSYQPEKC